MDWASEVPNHPVVIPRPLYFNPVLRGIVLLKVPQLEGPPKEEKSSQGLRKIRRFSARDFYGENPLGELEVSMVINI